MPLWQPSKTLARPQYYDRDPVPVAASYLATVAPHGSTIRASYSTAYPYAAFIESLIVDIIRVTAAAAVGPVSGHWEFLPFSGGTYRLQWVYFVDNTLQVQRAQEGNSFGYMAFGDTIQFVTVDGSTGGTNFYLGSMKGTEFYY